MNKKRKAQKPRKENQTTARREQTDRVNMTATFAILPLSAMRAGLLAAAGEMIRQLGYTFRPDKLQIISADVRDMLTEATRPTRGRPPKSRLAADVATNRRAGSSGRIQQPRAK